MMAIVVFVNGSGKGRGQQGRQGRQWQEKARGQRQGQPMGAMAIVQH
jgi:hypothetical protein